MAGEQHLLPSDAPSIIQPHLIHLQLRPHVVAGQQVGHHRGGRWHFGARLAFALTQQPRGAEVLVQNVTAEGGGVVPAQVAHLPRVGWHVVYLALVGAPPVQRPLRTARGLVYETDLVPGVLTRVDLGETEVAPVAELWHAAADHYVTEALTIQREGRVLCSTSELGDGGSDVEMVGRVRPYFTSWHAWATHVHRPRVCLIGKGLPDEQAVLAEVETVVGGEDHEGVVQHAQLLEPAEDVAEHVVNVERRRCTVAEYAVLALGFPRVATTILIPVSGGGNVVRHRAVGQGAPRRDMGVGEVGKGPAVGHCRARAARQRHVLGLTRPVECWV
eukprot:Hpha_TRINITY_DN25966_c0_g1::TRINITY_DN25966_c0_g1_i1::g.185368::m.185368